MRDKNNFFQLDLWREIKFNLPKSKIFLIACLVFISGIALASFLPAEFFKFKIWWFAAAVFFSVLAVWFWENNERAGVKPVPTALLLMAVFFLAVWRYGAGLPADAPDKIWHYNLPVGQAGGQTVMVRGYVANEPDIREKNQKLEIAVGAIHELPLREISGKILVTTDLYPEYKYGDELELECKLQPPEEYQGFAYDRYLARYQIYSVCYYPKITLQTPSLISPLARGRNSGGGSGTGVRALYSKIFFFKAKLAGLIDAGLPEPESSLARPIVFGGQRGLEQAIRDDFQKTGLTHIMAVSGFNVSILAAVVMAVLLGAGVSRQRAFYLAAAFLAGYIVLVGLPASALRAGLMGFLVLWALKLGRLNKITNALVLTAAVLLLINPKLLRDDVGFQLSFLALAGLVYVYPILEAVWQKIKLPKLKGVSDGLLMTLAAQIFTLPILAYNFSQISLIAPLANLAVLWVVPALTVLVLIALPLAALMPGLAAIWFLPAYVFTKYILAIVKFMAGLPFSYITVDYLWWGWAAVYYSVVVFIVIKLQQPELFKDGISDKI